MGLPGIGFLLGIVFMVVGLGIATLFRSIDFEDMGAVFKTALGLIVAGWVSLYLWALILPAAGDPSIPPGWEFYATRYGAELVTNIIALGVISLFVTGFKIRGFFGLLVAGVVVTLVDSSLGLYQLARVMLAAHPPG